MTLEEIRQYCQQARAGHRDGEVVKVTLDVRDVEALLAAAGPAFIITSETCNPNPRHLDITYR